MSVSDQDVLAVLVEEAVEARFSVWNHCLYRTSL